MASLVILTSLSSSVVSSTHTFPSTGPIPVVGWVAGSNTLGSRSPRAEGVITIVGNGASERRAPRGSGVLDLEGKGRFFSFIV